MMLGSWLTRLTINSRSARAVGLRKSCGDLMNSIIGVIMFCGKWRSIALYPATLSTSSGNALRSS